MSKSVWVYADWLATQPPEPVGRLEVGSVRGSERKLKGVTDDKKALMQDLLTGKVRVQVDARELAEV